MAGTGKAKHPANPERPESPAVRKALETMDMDALKKALTHRQRRFCDEYTVDFNGAAAAVRAGYSSNYPDRQAHQLLQNQGIATYVEYLTASKASKIMSVNPDYVIKGIVDIVSKEHGKDNDKLRGFELLGKILGMFVEKTELSGRDGGAIEVENRRIDEEASEFTRMLKAMNKKKD